MSRLRASSPMGTGTEAPQSASSMSARTAYGDLEVIASKREKVRARVTRKAARSLGAAARPHGVDLLPVRPAGLVVGPRGVGPDRAQVRSRRDLRRTLLLLVARSAGANARPGAGRGH